MKCRPLQLLRRGYTLIEVLAAGAVISVGMAAAASLASALMAQEEVAWRISITRNYQENMVRLWQLGLSPTGSKDASNIGAVMPSQSYSTLLNEAINGTPYIIETGSSTPEGLGRLQSATAIATVNVSSDPVKEVQGSTFSLQSYRPSLPVSLRSAALNP